MEKKIDWWYLDATVNDDKIKVVVGKTESSSYPSDKDFKKEEVSFIKNNSGEYIAEMSFDDARDLSVMANMTYMCPIRIEIDTMSFLDDTGIYKVVATLK